MHSTLTEPIGPRSPDDILAVVYQRTEHVRRRRRQQLAAAVAAVALGVAGLVSLRPGDDEASRVRVVDDRRTGTEEATDESTDATPSVGSDEPPASSTTTSVAPRRGPQPTPGNGNTAQATAPTTVPPLPTTTTLPTTIDNGPSTKLLAQEGDLENDSVPGNWYYDIVHGSMQVDLRQDLVVFTTRYRSPNGSGTRDTRVLRSSFDYDNSTVTVSVTESANALSEVRLNTRNCAGCTARLDDREGVLTVAIPIDTMNAYLATLFEEGASIEQATVSDLHVTTGPVDADDLVSDESGTTQ